MTRPCLDVDGAAGRLRAVREAIRTYRLRLARDAGFDGTANLDALRGLLLEAAGQAEPGLEPEFAALAQAVAFAPDDPYAGILAAEAALERLEEAHDRQRCASWRRSRKGLAALCVLACAVLATAGIWLYVLSQDKGPVIDILAGQNAADVHTEGVNTVTETGGGKAWRWAFGPQTEIWFKDTAARLRYLDMLVYNMIPGQVLQVSVNDGLAERFEVAAGGFEQPAGTLRLALMTRPGQNVVRIVYADWNKKGADFAPEDNRPLSVAYGRLRIGPGPE